MSQVFEETSSRGSILCRACESTELDLIVDLGSSPIANSLPPKDSEVVEMTYPLRLRICRQCLLGQISEYETREQIFSIYPYLSSTSSYWVEHAKKFAESILHDNPRINEGYVLELASNDGYLLQHFKSLNVDVLGVEPASNVAEISKGKGIPTLDVFFGDSVAEDILKEKGYPALIVANNVAAHVPDMLDFFSGISRLCGPKTIVTIENPSLGFLLQKSFYDTIYHEHFSYLSIEPVRKLAEQLGMKLFRAETLSTHGGSIRYWLTKDVDLQVEESVSETAKEEANRGVGNASAEKKFSSNVQGEMKSLHDWLEKQDTNSVIGYGAAAKTVTTFFAAKLQPEKFISIVDANPLKQNRRLPGTTIPIVGLDILSSTSAKKILVFPWNLEEEILKSIRKYNSEIEVWIPNPIRKAREISRT